MKRKSGFTLVEMLIVVVIIGILSAALIPRLTGYMARTRDLKRHADLRDIAAAITMYKDDKGILPTRGTLDWYEHTWGTFQASPCLPYETFERTLRGYITSVPRDPSSENLVQLHKLAVQNYPNYFYGKYVPDTDISIDCDGRKVFKGKQGVALQPGQYFYQIFQKGGIQMGAAIIAAKVETPQMANYIRFKEYEDLQGGFLKRNYAEQVGGDWHQEIMNDIDDLKLCSSIEKGKEAKWEFQADGKVVCTFSSEDQLYYIVKIE